MIDMAYKIGLTTANFTTLLDIFPSTISELEKTSRTYVIIDGIDECSDDDREDVLEAIRTISSYPQGIIKLFVSSRADADLRSTFEGGKFEQLPLFAESIGLDISSYIHGTVGNMVTEGQLVVSDKDLIDEIISALVDGA
jgi:hypothetical protein